MFRRGAPPVRGALTSLALVAVGATAVPAAPGDAAQRPPVVPEVPDVQNVPDLQDGGREPALYIISYDEETVTAGDVATEVAQAGGEVVSILEPLDAALITAPGEAAVADVVAADGVEGATRNRSVGATEPGRTPRFAGELPLEEAPAARPAGEPRAPGAQGADAGRQAAAGEPLEPRQWGLAMVGATAGEDRPEATGRGVDVGIIDTGIDATHPDLAPNFDAERSRSFVSAGGPGRPCSGPTCTPADVDGDGHGTHVAGVVGAARDDRGIAGVAPEVDLVNLRAGTDAGYFFVYEVSSALVAAADMGLDVVNMSFFTDPWLYNCTSAADYVSGTVTPAEIAEQRLVRRLMLDALDYAHERGVTLVAAAGNHHTDMAASQREDLVSPDYPPGASRPRVVTDDCLDLPAEGPTVITVSSVGPSGVKAGYSNHGLGSIDVAGPGGWFRDHAGTARYQDPGNLVLSSYPLAIAQRDGAADPDGRPTDGFAVQDCRDGECGFYRYLQGTSMAAPFVAGVAALVVERHGEGTAEDGYSLDPERVSGILAATATDRPCPPGGIADYAAAGRPPSWNAPCTGDAGYNSLYGDGVVSAVNAAG